MSSLFVSFNLTHCFHSDLKMQLSEMEQQLSDKLELTNQMNSLLVQRAARINELEGSFELHKQVPYVLKHALILTSRFAGETIRV